MPTEAQLLTYIAALREAMTHLCDALDQHDEMVIVTWDYVAEALWGCASERAACRELLADPTGARAEWEARELLHLTQHAYTLRDHVVRDFPRQEQPRGARPLRREVEAALVEMQAITTRLLDASPESPPPRTAALEGLRAMNDDTARRAHE